MTIPSALLDHYQSRATSLAWGLLVTRANGASDPEFLALTSLDRSIAVDGITYEPGLDVSSISSTSGLSVDNAEFTIIGDDFMARLEVLAGKWDGSVYELFRFNWQAPTDGRHVVKVGKLGNLTPKYGSIVAEMRDLRQALQQDTTAIFQEPCRYEFGSTRCTKNVADYTVTGTLTAVTSQSVVTDSARSEAADWFGYGEFTFTSGQNSGLTFKVSQYTNGEFTLVPAAVFAIEVGDTYSAVAGCRKRWIEDCRDKFDNVLNFGGDPAKPTGDAIIAPPSETALTIPPAPAPAPAPSLPTPGAFNAAARIVGLDYTQTYDAGNVSDLSRYGIVIRGFTTNKAQTIGATYVSDLKTANPDLLFGGYIKFNEMKSPVSSGEDFYTPYTQALANGWFVLSQPAGTHVQSAPGSGSDEMNITSATPTNGSGQHWPQYYAEFIHDNRFAYYSPDYAFFDNAWVEARVTADYACTGTGNQSPSASASAIIAGNTAAVTAIRAENSGIKIIANADSDLSALSGVFDAAFNEGCVGRSYGTFTTSGISGVRERQLAHISNTLDGLAILGSYGESTDYATHRFAKCMAMLFDSWHCAIDSTPQLHAVWLDESGQDVGVATDAVPSAAWSNSVWARRFENGLVLVNPTSSSKTVDPTTLGTYTRFTGTQDSTLNNGAAVTGSITLAAESGLLLVV